MSLTVNRTIEGLVKKVNPTDVILELTFTNNDNQSHNIFMYYPPNDIAPYWSNQKGITTYFSIGFDKLNILYNKIMPYIKENHTILELPCGMGEFAINFYIKNKNTNINYIGIDICDKFIELNNINYKANNMKFKTHDCIKNPYIEYNANHLICLGIFGQMKQFIVNYASSKNPEYIFIESNLYRYSNGEVVTKELDTNYNLIEIYRYNTKNIVKNNNKYIPFQKQWDRVLVIYKRKS